MGVISQRLIRRLCPSCAETYVPAEHEVKFLGLPQEEYHFKKPVGCPLCNQNGYKGRIAVHEILLITKEHRDLIAGNATNNQLLQYSIEHGLSTLKQECIRLVREGITSFDEVMDITYKQESVNEAV
jgi:type IV pilus assembly protein PilB